jgi:hypothetical protein
MTAMPMMMEDALTGKMVPYRNQELSTVPETFVN